MIREPFAFGDSVIHRIDPRIKIVFAAVGSVLIAISHRFPSLIAALTVSVLIVLLARLDLKEAGKRLLVVFGFLLLLWLVLPLTFEGDPIARIGFLTVNHPGVILAAQITLKSTSILLLLMALISTMNFATLGHALDRLRIPGKMVHLLLMTYRYIFVIEQEYQRLWRAVRIRGFRPTTNIHTYKTYAYLVGMLFIRASERADQVYRAMRCRGFKDRFYCLSDFPSHPRNWIFSILMAFFSITLALLEWGI